VLFFLNYFLSLSFQALSLKPIFFKLKIFLNKMKI
jgi:hypothetical protein